MKEKTDMIKVIAFNGSPKKDGNTSQLIKMVFEVLEKERIKTQMIQIGGTDVKGCIACGKCWVNKDKKCAVKSDAMNEHIAAMIEADGIILASPTYFCNVTAEIKALIDRAGMVAKANDDMFKRKVGAAVVAVRRGGATHVFNSINHLFFISQMIVPGSSYWNFGVGLEPGDVQEDNEGVETMRDLGKNMAWVLKKIK